MEPLWGRILIKFSHFLLTISSALNIIIYSYNERSPVLFSLISYHLFIGFQVPSSPGNILQEIQLSLHCRQTTSDWTIPRLNLDIVRLSETRTIWISGKLSPALYHTFFYFFYKTFPNQFIFEKILQFSNLIDLI